MRGAVVRVGNGVRGQGIDVIVVMIGERRGQGLV